MKLKLFLFAFAAIASLFGVSASAQSIAITNARIVTVSGDTIEKGTVVVRDGLIESVGANAKVPADAQTIDASGLNVYPGFIDALTSHPHRHLEQGDAAEVEELRQLQPPRRQHRHPTRTIRWAFGRNSSPLRT